MERITIGPATLYCGDAFEALAIIGEVDHVITDPPYEDEVHRAAAKGRLGRIRTDGVAMHGDYGFAGVNAQRGDIVRAVVAASRGWALLFTLAEGVRAWRDELQAAKAKYDTTLAWIKPDSMPRMNGQGAARGFECVVTAWCGRGHKRWNGGGKRGVFHHCVNGPARHGLHPTEKPVALMAELVALYSDAGQTVCDPMMGTGATGVACVRSGRPFVGVERERKWFDAACARIEAALAQGDLFAAAGGAEKAGKQLGLFGKMEAAG